MGAPEVTAAASRLATDDSVAARLHLDRDVPGVGLAWLDGLVRARRPQRRPTVLGRDDVVCLIGQMQGAPPGWR
jgi:hypothetical protein